MKLHAIFVVECLLFVFEFSFTRNEDSKNDNSQCLKMHKKNFHSQYNKDKIDKLGWTFKEHVHQLRTAYDSKVVSYITLCFLIYLTLHRWIWCS